LEEPLRDLGLIQELAPEVLSRAVEQPYRVPSDCAALRTELAMLDAVLGPDVDAAGPGGERFDVLGELFGFVPGIPFRNVVRLLTGADARDRTVRQAVSAGLVRRGFLKGRASALCA
jgi:hypothetical protein